MSPVSPSRGPGRRRHRRRLGPRVPGADRTLRLPLGRAFDLEPIAVNRICGGRGPGAVRGRRGRPRPRHDLLDLGDHGRPDDADQLAASCCEIMPARQAGALALGPAGHPAPLPRQGAPFAEGLPMAPVGRRGLLALAADSQSGSLGRATDQGRRLPVDLLEDRPLSRRRPRPSADRLGDRDDGVRGQRDVSPLAGGRPSGRDQLLGLTPVSRCPLGRGGPCRFDIAGRRTILTVRRFRRAKPAQHLVHALPQPVEQPLHQAA